MNDLNSEEILETFYEKDLKKASQEEFRIEEVIKRKVNKLFFKWNWYDNSIIHSIAGLKRKIKYKSIRMSQYFLDRKSKS